MLPGNCRTNSPAGSCTLRILLTFTALVEVGTGLALIIGPAMIVRLFLGVDESGEETPLGRFLGIALLALGWACWPHRQRIDCDAPALHGMLIYNLLILLYLTYLDTVGHLGSERTDRPTKTG
jgi:hypothetical protein